MAYNGGTTTSQLANVRNFTAARALEVRQQEIKSLMERLEVKLLERFAEDSSERINWGHVGSMTDLATSLETLVDGL